MFTAPNAIGSCGENGLQEGNAMKKRMSDYVRPAHEKFVTNNQRAEAAFAIEQGVRAIARWQWPLKRYDMRSRWPIDVMTINSMFGKVLHQGRVVRKVESDAMFLADAIEQGLRAIDRVKLALCSEHGCPKRHCIEQYHARDERLCWCGLRFDQHIDPKRDYRPRPSKAPPGRILQGHVCEVKS